MIYNKTTRQEKRMEKLGIKKLVECALHLLIIISLVLIKCTLVPLTIYPKSNNMCALLLGIVLCPDHYNTIHPQYHTFTRKQTDTKILSNWNQFLNLEIIEKLLLLKGRISNQSSHLKLSQTQ